MGFGLRKERFAYEKAGGVCFDICTFVSLTGCAKGETKVWDWVQSLRQEDVVSVIPRRDVDSDARREFPPLDEAEVQELLTLLGGLRKDSFTHNKHLRGGTPTFHVEMTLSSGSYYLNEYNGPGGALEIKYNDKQWLIEDAALAAFVRRVTQTESAQ